MKAFSEGFVFRSKVVSSLNVVMYINIFFFLF